MPPAPVYPALEPRGGEKCGLDGGLLIRVREYGTSGFPVVVLHGGPGGSGYMAPVARELADSFQVLEPLQRGSGDEPLTVARHVADLHELVEARFEDTRPALVGHSWGAMLALAYAAAHPGRAAALVLIGCGTFDPAARDRLREIRESRMDEDLRRRLERLALEVPDPNKRLAATAELMLPLFSHELATREPARISHRHAVAERDTAVLATFSRLRVLAGLPSPTPRPSGRKRRHHRRLTRFASRGGEICGLELVECDARAHDETWEDMLLLQETGVYPAAFATIDAPVIMLHGAADPHPGPMIRASLEPHLPQLEYLEWERCGHYPWLERAVRDEFFAVLRRWVAGRLKSPHL